MGIVALIAFVVFIAFVIVIFEYIFASPGLTALLALFIIFGILRGMAGAQSLAFNRFFAYLKPHSNMSNSKVHQEIRRRRNALVSITTSLAASLEDEHPYAYNNLYRYTDEYLGRSSDLSDGLPRIQLLDYLNKMPTTDTFQSVMMRKRDELIADVPKPEETTSFNIGTVTRIKEPEYQKIGDQWVAKSRKSTSILDIPEEMRLEHMYMIGKTGAGKTNTLTHLLLQDIRNGRGICVVGPMRGLFREHILPRIPKERLYDVVYLDLEEQVRPISINLLEMQPGETENTRAGVAYDTITSAVGDIGGTVMEVVFSEAIRALVERKGSTLADIELLLDMEDSSLRDEIVATTKHPRIKKYWSKTFYQINNMAGSVMFLLNRLSPLFNPPFDKLLCSPKSSINIKQIMDDQKILLVELSPGVAKSSDVAIVGKIITAQIQLAMWSRDSIPEKQRRPFFVYIDEFSKYLTHSSADDFEEMMTRARQLRVGLVLAHQNTAQIRGVLDTIVGNANIFAAFNVDYGDAAFVQNRLINLQWLSNLRNNPDYSKGDIRERIGIQIQSQGKGQGFIRVGRTSDLVQVRLVDDPVDSKWRDTVIATSKLNYGLNPVHMLPKQKQPQPLEDLEPIVEVVDASHHPQSDDVVEDEIEIEERTYKRKITKHSKKKKFGDVEKFFD